MYGSIAKPLPADASKRPPNISPDHTHQWTVYVRGVNNTDITYWLKKVQFKLHETYSQSLRTIEAPAPFEVTETGWGEFEITIKLFFTPESGEKPQSIYHQLKLHPFGEDREAAKERGDAVTSQLYEEVVFNEPSETVYDILTNDAPPGRGKGGSKGSKQKTVVNRTAEIPTQTTPTNPYSAATEMHEIDRVKEARKEVEALIKEERARLEERDKELRELRAQEGIVKVK